MWRLFVIMLVIVYLLVAFEPKFDRLRTGEYVLWYNWNDSRKMLKIW